MSKVAAARPSSTAKPRAGTAGRCPQAWVVDDTGFPKDARTLHLATSDRRRAQRRRRGGGSPEMFASGLWAVLLRLPRLARRR
ncbi:hypothetical protein, partial [Streptomyces sp. Ncost-T10-10d]|uniref:hypothetical protein n=1 Tax=Streptomyces sp. Ncost-T10-10d TaxID=1839774 RepID=UPI00081F03D0